MNSNVDPLRSGPRKRRSASGQAIAEGAAMMPVIIGLAVFLIILLMFVGFTLYYHQKLGFVANEVARYAADRLAGDGSDEDLEVLKGLGDQANSLTALVGLPKVLTSVSPAKPTKTISVRLKMSGINILNGSVPSVPIEETAAAIIDNTKPKGWTAFYQCEMGSGWSGMMWVPVYGVSLYNTKSKTYHYQVGPRIPPGLPHLANYSIWNDRTLGWTIWDTSGKLLYNIDPSLAPPGTPPGPTFYADPGSH